MQADDVLLCKIVPHINRVWTVAPKSSLSQIASGEWIVYRKHHSDPHYLRYCLTERSFRDKFMETVSGVGGSLMRARPSEVAEIEIPLAPLPEQRRIVAKIDSLSGKSKRARDHLDHIPRLVEKYKQAVLAAAFATDDYKLLSLADLADAASSIRYGVLQPGVIKDVGVPLIRVCDLKDQQVAWDELRRISPDIDKQYANARVQDGDVLMSVVGTIGRVALVKGMREPSNIARAVARIRPDLKKVVPSWLAWRLQNDDCQNTFAQDAREVARKTLNISLIKDVKLAVPTLGHQAQTVEKIEHLFAWIDRLAAEAISARKLVDRLDQAVLAKAFRGELVPQDPNDEPASVLLDRIRSERAEAGKIERRGRRSATD